MTVRAEGGHITVHVNGKKTAELFIDPEGLRGILLCNYMVVWICIRFLKTS
jgi:hypothetical protein